MKKAKMLSLTASLVLAITFTLSCSDDNGDEGGDGDGNSSSSVVNGGGGSSSSGGGQGGGTSSGGDGGSSSSAVQCLDADSGTFTDDRDGKEYRYVTICSQTWFAENLNYDAEGSKCYDNKEANCTKYGKLYDWATAMALPSSCNYSSCSSQIQPKHKGICPAGWYIPSDTEWAILTSYVGSKAGTKLKATSGWNNRSDGSSGNGTDDYGFSALPGGYSYNEGGSTGLWWSAREEDRSTAHIRVMSSKDDNARLEGYGKTTNLISVRCLQD